ncbi:MAG: valine--tRNA ligase [Myxococcota bacterium]
MSDFPKRFDFREAEPRIYQTWLDHDCFRSAHAPDGTVLDERRKDARPFTIVIPPPNITGRLHMGHALNNTVQDVLVRYHRMKGEDALWIPGTDHAGIATQTVVKKQLDAEGIDYRELGREKVIERIWQWREEFGDAILLQLRRMGCSCDWSRTRFTMDDGLNRAVRRCFVELYRQGLIYRGKRIVNWCPVDRTALSDDEVEKEDEKGKMYHLRYPLADDPKRHLVVATTRPETMFGDVAVAVHPEDRRYRETVGRSVILPLMNKLLPVIADEHADPEKGTGVVKITPAHDPNDFEVGLRHGLPQIDVMHEDATLNEQVPEAYRGMDRYKARQKILEDLESMDLVEKIESHVLAIGRSYRSKVPIEFRLSDQWFVRMEPLARKALEANGYVEEPDGWVRAKPDAGVAFHPDRFEKVYLHWLSNIRDWCISRQIWWGHRIPAWHNVETNEILVAEDVPASVEAAPELWRQDDDVLDTWFSSWLWPFSTLGWPDNTPDLSRYYPTSVLSTAKDIIFFWVARMNFAGLQFNHALPYRDVYLHSTIADERGVTMSKSKGNGIDPLTLIEGASLEALKRPVMEARPSNTKEIINRLEKNFPNGFEAVGADAMRWTLIYSITEGENVKLALQRFLEGRSFVTKLWNGAGRIITALEAERDVATSRSPSSNAANGALPGALTDEDHWILARIDSVTTEVRTGLEEFDFARVAQALYHLVWDDYCSWALELSKTRLQSSDASIRLGVLRAMGSGLADILRLLHPIIPFVTEELWSRLRPAMDALDLWLDRRPESELLVRDLFPEPRNPPQPDLERRFAILQRFVGQIRQLRASYRIKDSERIIVQTRALDPDTQPMLDRCAPAVSFLARLESVEFVDARSPGMAAIYDPAFEVYLDLGRYVDLSEEVGRLEKEIAKATKELESTRIRLSNRNFVDKAPPEKVEAARAHLQALETKAAKLTETRDELASLTSVKHSQSSE